MRKFLNNVGMLLVHANITHLYNKQYAPVYKLKKPADRLFLRLVATVFTVRCGQQTGSQRKGSRTPLYASISRRPLWNYVGHPCGLPRIGKSASSPSALPAVLALHVSAPRESATMRKFESRRRDGQSTLPDLGYLGAGPSAG